MNKILTIMDLKTFFKQHLRTVLLVLFLAVIVFCVLLGVRKLSNHTLVVGHPDNIVVISPTESQDVIVIGDPQQVKIKPNNKNK